MKTLNLKSSLAIVAVLIVVAAVIYKFMLERGYFSERLLSERPAKTATDYQTKPTQSFLGASIDVPYSLLSQAAEQSIDNNETVKLSGKAAGARYEGEIHIQRIAPVSFNPAGAQALKLSTSLRLKGEVGFLGGVARALGLDKMDVDATVTLMANVDIGIGPDWTPSAKVTVLEPQWISPPRIKVLHSTITFKDKANAAIDKAARKLPEKIKDAIAKLDLKEKVTKAWKVYRFPLSGDALQGKAVVDLVPSNVYYSGIKYFADNLQVNFELGVLASVNIGNVPLPNVPALSDIKPLNELPRFTLNLPVLSEYSLLEALLNAKIDATPFKLESAQGPIQVTVNHIEIYPSGQRLAIGIDFKAIASNRLLNVQGEVFLLARPQIDNSGEKVILQDVGIYKNLDNEIWSTTSALLSDRIAKSIEQDAQFNVSEKIADLRKGLRTRLQALSKESHTCIKISNDALKLSNITMASQYLVIEGLLDANLSLALKAEHCV